MQETPDSTHPPLPPHVRRQASVAFLIGLLVLAFLMVSAAQQQRPGPRLSRNSRLVDLIRLQDRRTATMRDELEALRDRLRALEAGAAGGQERIAAIRAQAEALAPYAGLAAVNGPGMRVVLRDSTLQESPTGDPNDLVIHEQDIQSVVNALWAGGAEAIAINGERITGLSAIRCVGNTLLLHGSVYSPPYRIAAIGDAKTMTSALDADEGVERLRIVSEKFKLGFDVTRSEAMELPAFRGVTGLRYADAPPAARTRRR